MNLPNKGMAVNPSSPPSLSGTTATPPTTPQKPSKKPKLPKDNFRESIETIVFVVVLVLLLKLFVVEAYVIPTGSMAETLLGYNKTVVCDECGHSYPVNSTDEVAPFDGIVKPIRSCKCPNCGYEKTFTPSSSPSNNSGDRVLVHKTWYHIDPAKRWDTVVFKYPRDPQKNHEPMNYIKRLWGFGDETYAIHRGEILMAKGCMTKDRAALESAIPEKDLWHSDHMYRNSPESMTEFEMSRQKGFVSGQSTFELLRKPDVIAMAERRLVYDNDHQAKTLIEKNCPPRWNADPARSKSQDWSFDNGKAPKVFTHASGDISFIRYQHLIENAWANPPKALPAPIRNTMGYNSVREKGDAADYWCSDLMLECKAELNGGAVVLELSKSADRFQARFEDEKVKLIRVNSGKETVMAEQTSPVKKTGSYDLRFANIDCRLRVWVNGKPIDFGGAADYDLMPVSEFDSLDNGKEGWTKINDLDAPASIGAYGNVTVSNLKIWRDTVYTAYRLPGMVDRPDRYSEYAETFYVHPGHYLCLGDNSSQSSDSRDWGVVPERLMLGRACFVFYPIGRIGFIK